MPQIVEVLKYVHEVVETESLGVAVGVDVATHEQKYKLLTKDLRSNMDVLLAELKRLYKSNPALKVQIEFIENFLIQLNQHILTPRIVEVTKEKIVEKIVEKDNIVRVPTQDERSVKMELTLSMLVEQLIMELKKVKKSNPNVQFDLDDDVKLIFFSELDSASRSVGDDFNMKIKQFSDSIYRKFESLGNWSYDHQLMLNSFLQERFLMANLGKNANLEIEKTKSIQMKREEDLKESQSQLTIMNGVMSKVRSMEFEGMSIEQKSIISNVFAQFDQYQQSGAYEPVRDLLDLNITDQRIQSLIREKDAEISQLRDRIFSIEKSRSIGATNESQNEIIRVLQSETLKLKNENISLRSEQGSQELIEEYKIQIHGLNDRILALEQDKSDLTAELSNLQRQYQVELQFSSSIKNSAKTEMRSPDQMVSPVSKYPLGSPQNTDYGIRMVDSKIEENRATGLGMTDSRRSGTSSSQVTSSRADLKSSNVSNQQASYQASSSMVKDGSSTAYYGQSGVQGSSGIQNSGLQGSRTQQSGAQQYGANNNNNSSLYSSTSSNQKDGSSYSAQYGQGQGSNSSVYQSGNRQSGMQSGYQGNSSYQPSSSSYTSQSGQSSLSGQQGGQTGSSFQSGYQSSTYQPKSGQTGQSGQSGSSGFSSSYTYKKQ